MIAARSSRVSLVAHAVDDLGALCGRTPTGGWVASRIPVNCPSCLVAASRPRFAVSRAVAASDDAGLLHVRRVGPEGVTRRSSGGVAARALCGVAVHWDEDELGAEHVAGRGLCAGCRAGLPERLSRPLAPSAAAR